nr:hypothetical protein [Tanacetum cinerariifolium]
MIAVVECVGRFLFQDYDFLRRWEGKTDNTKRRNVKIFSSSRMCAQLESLNVYVPPASQTIELQTLYSVQGWDTYAWAFQTDQDDASVVFTNPGMEDDPTCGPIIDDIVIKKLFMPTKSKDNAVLNGDFEEGPWMFRNASLGVLLPTNLDEETSSLSD